jgi:hypothetical protein
MNAIPLSLSTRWLLVCLCVLMLLPVFAGSIFAGPVDNLVQHSNIVFDWASDRGHMIQVSLVIVALGIAVMWWYR